MAEKHYPFESALLESVGNMSDTSKTNPSEEASLVSILKGVVVQQQTIINNQTTIINNLATINTTLVNGINVSIG